MKPFLIVLILTALLLVPVNAQEREEKIEEYMDVINVEILARAMKNGQPVGGLLKEDLTLYENGQPVEITSFFEVKRRMGVQNLKLDAQNIVRKKPRIFFLFFWISEPGSPYKEALDHFFKNVYQEKDYVILATQNDVFKMPPGTSIKNIQDQLTRSVDETTFKITQFQRIFAKRLETDGNHFRELFREYQTTRDSKRREMIVREIGQKRDNLVQTIRGELKQFKYNHLKINAGRMLELAGSIKNSTVEKWGITFFQPMAFPILDTRNEYIAGAFSLPVPGSESSTSGISEYDKAVNEVKRPDHLTYLKKISQAFFENNTPFHTILLNSTADIVTNEEFLRKDYMASEWEEVFRNISKVSGGDIVSGTKIIESMNQISRKEDIYYILTYSPQSMKGGKRKLKLESSRPGLKIFHHNQIDLAKIKNISLENLSYTHPEVALTLKNYRMLYQGERFEGKIKLLYSISDPKGDNKTVAKDFSLTEQEVRLTLDLHLKSKSRYTISVIAIDLNANKKSMSSIKVVTPEPTLKQFKFDIEKPRLKQDRLPAILTMAAGYCEKLKKAAFHFYCQEKITEEFMEKRHNDGTYLGHSPSSRISRIPRLKQRHLIYDYQIVLKDRQIKETRTLIFEKHKKVNIKNAPLKTRFTSEYSFYMPLIFAGENQDKYHYTLLKEQRIKGIKTYKISVEPKSPEMGAVAHGVAWVSQEDGSVVKILVHPRSFKGVDKLRKAALNRGYDLMLTDEHLYLKERDGIRFPTQTMISERYISTISSRRMEFESTRTYFTYTKYRFFNVETQVTTHDPS